VQKEQNLGLLGSGNLYMHIKIAKAPKHGISLEC
jgi:hypothetical protein